MVAHFPAVLAYAPLRKGELKQISVIGKTRQGRRATTCVTGFENFQIEADGLAEELRKACASSTSVNSLPGKAAGQEVMVQGKQLKAVTDLLIAKGVPKQWIEAKDTTTGKK
jgi:translation initiation factor 2D